MRSIELKIIVSIVFFTLSIVALERYQLSKNITEQFVSSKKAKNRLLMDTISPVISLNLSLGLSEANRGYLDQIADQNSDIELIKLVDAQSGELLYKYYMEDANSVQTKFNHCSSEITDYVTQQVIATIELQFSNLEYEKMLQKSREITLEITLITVIMLVLFIFWIKYEFRELKELRNQVLIYTPKDNNFPLDTLEGKDEVSLIHNAIVSMVKRIRDYTDLLDKQNITLENKVKQRTLELEHSNKELKRLASIDPLTKLYNRRYFTKTSEQILEIAKRNKSELSIAMIDIDKFKCVNDKYGHKFGDKVIMCVTSVLKSTLRKSDIACRFGGEEFLVLFPDTDIDGVFTIAEKIRVEIMKQAIEIEKDKHINVSVSIGVAQLDLEKDEEMESLIHRADSAMYRAKEEGRNLTSV